MGKTCCVPMCTSGYRSNPEKVSLFKVPKDRLEIWNKRISRGDRAITVRDSVCEKHFSPEYIIRQLETACYNIPLEKCKLSSDAVPTRFPNSSKYLTPSKRKKIKTSQNLDNDFGEDNDQNEEKSLTVTNDNKREKCDSFESTTEDSGENHRNEDSEQGDCLADMIIGSNDVNSESKISNTDTKDEEKNKIEEESNSDNFDYNLDDLSVTLKGHRRKRNLVKWSDEEKRVTENFFQRHIRLRISPKKREVEHLMKLYPRLFKDRKWDVIKVYVCNKYNSNKSKSIALSPVPTDPIEVEDNDGISLVSVQSKQNNEVYPFVPTDITEEPSQITDPLLETTLERKVEKYQPLTFIKKEQQVCSTKICSKKVILSPKSSTLLDRKVMSANGKYIAVLKQLPQTGEASQEKKSLQNSQTTTTTSTGDNIVLKRLVFDAEKRCFRAVDSNELVNAMSKKIRVLSVNQEGMEKGISSLNILQKVPPPLNEPERPEKQFEKDVLQVSTDDMCVLCARKKSPTHNISHLVDLIKDIAGVNLSSLNLPLRACEDCVADVNVTLKLRKNIKKAYDNLFKKDDTVTINVLPPKTDRQYGTSHIIETDTITSEQTSTVVTEKSSKSNQESPNVSGKNLAIVENVNELCPDGFKKIKLPKISDTNDNCGQKRASVDNYARYHMDNDTERICEQLCITNSSQKEHLKECKKTDVTCKVCNRSFRCLQNLRWHMRCHVYKCEVCCKTFVYGVAKKNHLKQEHTEEEVQRALENMKTEKEKPKSFAPHSYHQTTPLNITEDEENKVIAVKEEKIDIEINELR